MELKCPICRKTVKILSRKSPDEIKFFPFCSERCKLIDLGAWLDSQYTIDSKADLEQQLSELPETSSR